jgi:hypothetical protein
MKIGYLIIVIIILAGCNPQDSEYYNAEAYHIYSNYHDHDDCTLSRTYGMMRADGYITKEELRDLADLALKQHPEAKIALKHVRGLKKESKDLDKF